MILACLLIAVGLALSALFSGSETGLYRAPRVRLLLDAVERKPLARGLLWLANRPPLFVATLLIGNNLANETLSLAVVLLAGELFGGESHGLELLATLVFTPVVFVYGELLPKNLFFHAPYRLLRRAAPLVLFFTILLFPFSALLWLLGRVIESFAGKAPAGVKSTLARKELQELLVEGEVVGVLHPGQRDLAQNLFSVAGRSVGALCIPVGRLPAAALGAPAAEVFRLARRSQLATLPVREAGGRELVGYVSLIELRVRGRSELTADCVRPFLDVSASDSHLEALVRLEHANEGVARVRDREGRTVGLLFAQRLTEPLFRET